MSDDIALSLRIWMHSVPSKLAADLATAADEIEQLRAALLRIRNQCDSAQRAYNDDELRPKFCELRDRIDEELAKKL